jgi:hypothetical protein
MGFTIFVLTVLTATIILIWYVLARDVGDTEGNGTITIERVETVQTSSGNRYFTY